MTRLICHFQKIFISEKLKAPCGVDRIRIKMILDDEQKYLLCLWSWKRGKFGEGWNVNIIKVSFNINLINKIRRFHSSKSISLPTQQMHHNYMCQFLTVAEHEVRRVLGRNLFEKDIKDLLPWQYTSKRYWLVISLLSKRTFNGNSGLIMKGTMKICQITICQISVIPISWFVKLIILQMTFFTKYFSKIYYLSKDFLTKIIIINLTEPCWAILLWTLPYLSQSSRPNPAGLTQTFQKSLSFGPTFWAQNVSS